MKAKGNHVKSRNVKSGLSHEQLMAAVALLDFSEEPALGLACASVYEEFEGGRKELACSLGDGFEELAALDRRIRKLTERVRLQSPSDGDYETAKLLLKRETWRQKELAARTKGVSERFLETGNAACAAWVKWARERAVRSEKLAEEIGRIGGAKAGSVARMLIHVVRHFRETADQLVLIESRFKGDVLASIKSRGARNRRRQTSPGDSFLHEACILRDEHRLFHEWAAHECANICRDCHLRDNADSQVLLK